MYIVFDTETTGLPENYNAPFQDTDNWPRLVQLAWTLHDDEGNQLEEHDYIIKPDGFTVPLESTKIHRITHKQAEEEGVDIHIAINAFHESIKKAKYLVAHNITFDEKVMACELFRYGYEMFIYDCAHIDTKNNTVDYCKIPAKRGGGYKWPTLSELYLTLFKEDFVDAHNALVDVKALSRCFFELLRLGVLGYGKGEYNDDIDESMLEMVSNDERGEFEGEYKPLANLCLHTPHSILEGASPMGDYIKLAKQYGQTSVAITDTATLSGAFEFFETCKKEGVKPIFGIEIFVNDNILTIEEPRAQGESYKIRLLVENEVGYKNLNKLLYLANSIGYYQTGRITTDWLREHREGLIMITSSLEGNISKCLQKGKSSEAEEYVQSMIKIFTKSNLYFDLQLNSNAQQKPYNNFVIKMASKYSIGVTVSNNIFFANPEDRELQDVVSAIKQNTSIARARKKDNRELYFYSSKDYYKKNKDNQFNYPEGFLDMCFKNTVKVADKCNFEFEIGKEKYPRYEPTQDVIDYFKTDNSEQIIYKLASRKLNQKLKFMANLGIMEVDEDVKGKYFKQLEYELGVIRDKKMLDYFLVNWEIVRDYRSKGFEIGPARGSAAGSLLSWCLDITKIDPLRFGLYFERFLNPTRNSPPDIDIDFMKGTDDVTDDFLINKYGKERVLSVSTFSRFNEKGCLKDVVRAFRGKDETGFQSPVYKVTDEMPKFFEKDMPLKKWFEEYPKDPKCSAIAKEFLLDSDNKRILDIVVKLQGQVRGIGQHAAGVVITPGVSWEYIPCNIIPKKKGEPNSIVTAFQEADGSGKDLSTLGILKLDRLKLETLNVIQGTIKLVEEKTGVNIKQEVDFVNIDDPKLFEELRLGLNHGVFQFESPGMNKLIKDMRVDKFEEVVACNALYRPGPMGIGAHTEYIENKFSPEKIKYVHKSLEPILSESKGVLVFQEQLMFIASEIGGMELGEGDMLRRAMDKASDIIQKEVDGEELTLEDRENKKYKDFQKYWGMMLDGGKRNGYSERDLNAIKAYVIKYLGYSFNKSHSVSYAYLAMQTLYLKHYYPTEFYTALLNHPKDSGKQHEVKAWLSAAISSAMSKGIDVLPPSRKSGWDWTMTGDNEISMGFSAIKGMGEIAYKELVDLLADNQRTISDVSKFRFFDIKKQLSKFNKTSFEACLKAGVFDDWSPSREELSDLFFKSKKKKKIDPKQLSMFAMSTDNEYESELKPDLVKYKATPDLVKNEEFMDVCNVDLSYIKRTINIKGEISERAGRDINGVNDFVGKDFYFFILENKSTQMTKSGKKYLKIKVSDGVGFSFLNIFGSDVKIVEPLLEKKGVYVTYLEQNDKGFINLSKRGEGKNKKIYLKKVDQI